MDAPSLLIDLFGRIPDLAEPTVRGASLELLLRAPGPRANPIAWLIWHVGRVQEAQIPPETETEQLWVSGSWAERFGLEPEPSNTGFGHDASQVAAVRPVESAVLLEYLRAVQERTIGYLEQLEAPMLDRIVDERWDPPVTLGARLVSVAVDCAQHLGQAAYLRGLLEA